MILDIIFEVFSINVYTIISNQVCNYIVQWPSLCIRNSEIWYQFSGIDPNHCIFLKLPDDSNSHPALRMTKLNNFYDSLTYAKCFCKALEVKRRKNSDITLWESQDMKTGREIEENSEHKEWFLKGRTRQGWPGYWMVRLRFSTRHF